MAGNPREHVKDKGFWDGGAPGQMSDGQSAGRTSGAPSSRQPKRVGIRTDIEFPPEDATEQDEPG